MSKAVGRSVRFETEKNPRTVLNVLEGNGFSRVEVEARLDFFTLHESRRSVCFPIATVAVY